MRRHLALVTVALAILVTNAHAAGLLRPRDGSPPIGVKSHRVTAVLEDGLARTTLRQTFVNPGNRMLEAIYTFPVPEGAALVDVAMEVGGQRLEGLLAERKQARKIYDSIVRRKKDPALVEQTGRNQFRLSVFPVMPRADTVVEVTWAQRIPLSQGAFRYVYPLFLMEGHAETEEDFTFVLTVDSSAPLATITSPIADMDIIRKGPGTAIASFERSRARLDEDVVVEARVEKAEPALSVRTFRRAGEDGFFQAVVTAPQARDAELIPRDVILVVDTSGSMGGAKIAQAKAAALYLLENLRPADRVNVIRFSSDVQGFADGPLPATPDRLAALAKFVNEFHSGGGTALGDALNAAVKVAPEPGRVRTVVFLTDGLPTVGEKRPAEIIGFAKVGGDRGLKVFTFGVGRDVNPSLLEGISRAGRGLAEVFRPEGEVESRLRRFLDRTASPVLANIRFEVEGLSIHDVHPRPIPDAYLGEQVTILGRYREGGAHPVRVRAVLGDRETVIEATADFRKTPGGAESTMHLFARHKLDFLESALRLRSGLSDDAYYASLDRGAYSTADEIIAEIVNLSLLANVQSAYTSFLVLLPEDRHRVDPKDLEALTAALERARVARAKAAGVDADAAIAKGEPGSAGKESPGEKKSSSGSSRGGYRGPAGEVPPGQRDPKDPQPVPESPATPAPGGAAPSTPPPPAPNGPGGNNGPGGLASPGGKRRSAPKTMTFENWLFWWAYNQDTLLARIRPAPAGPKQAVVDAKIVPALDQVIGNPKLHTDIRSSALLARARCGGDASLARRFLEIARTGKAQLVRESALLALGILGQTDPAIRDGLIHIVDSPADRVRVRCFAIVALGLLGDAGEPVHQALLRRLDGRETHLDVPVCALLAIGLIGDSRHVPELVKWVETRRIGDRKLPDLERAWAVDALGRIGDPRALPVLLKMLRQKGRYTKRSAAIAFGRILPQAEPAVQRKAVRQLVSFHRSEGDLTSRNFVVMSLGRIAGTAGVAAPVRKEVLDHLTGTVLRDGNKVTERPFGALAIGLVGMAPDASPELKEKLGEAVEESLRPLKGDKIALGASAVALGLLRHEKSVPRLIGVLEDRGQDKKLRGSAALALGMIGDRSANEAVMSALAEREDRDLRVDTARAAGQLRIPTAEKLLVEVLKDPKASQFVLGSVALALGRIGGETSLDPLLAILEPGKVDGMYPDLTRALVVVALGHLANGGRPDPLDRLSTDVNYRASVPALEELLTIL
ncbi:MAG: VIT domain-containing protein [Planctomycetota bacterium]